MRRCVWLWCAAMWLVACGGSEGGGREVEDPDAGVPDADGPDAEAPDAAEPDAEPDVEPPPGVPDGQATLANGLVVTADDQGIALSLEGRSLGRLVNAPVRTLTWTETIVGPTGIWDFRRSGEARAGFEAWRRFEDGPEGALVRWGGAGGAEARLTVSPGPVPGSSLLVVEVQGVEADSLELAFACEPEATFFGFGEQYNAVEQRGEAFELFVNEQGIGRNGSTRFLLGDEHTTYFPMPWWLDVRRGFGLLLDTPHRTLVDLCAADEDEARFEVTGGEARLEAVLFHGPGPLEVVEQLSQVVGRPKTPPAWAFGAPWISAQGGTEAVRAILAQLDEHEVPYGAIWSQDWTGVRVNLDGGLGVEYRWAPDAEHYPGLRALGDELRADGRRFLGYANPFIDPELPDHFDDMARDGLLMRNAQGEPYVFAAPNGTSAHPDFTRPQTFEYVQARLRQMVEVHGFDGWMADFGEWTPVDAVLDSGLDPMAAHNLFPVWWHQANREAMEAARPDGDWVTIARSGWTGVQAHSMIHWVGDQEATWEPEDGLPTVVPAMINLGLAGVPYVTHDIAGFSGGPSTKELYMRWVELGAFTPIMRTHEGNRRQENHNWNTDPETIAHFRRFARIHVALEPEWTALTQEASQTSAPMVRALALHFPLDEQARSISDQYLLGTSLMVAPVVVEGATSREVYLPEGQWFHVFTGQPYQGPTTVTVDAPVGTPPVFSLGVDRPDLRAIE